MKDLEEEILEYLKERRWHKIRPSDIAKSISIEAAELLELFQWADFTIAETKKNKGKMELLKKELADVLIYCIQMAVLLGLDTKAIVRQKLAVVREKYPAALMRNMQNRKNPGTERTYLKIKEAYRQGRKKE